MSAHIRFGTDGVRGPFGLFPVDADGGRRIGRAVAAWAAERDARPVIVLGRDTRASGPALAEAVVAGLVAGGARVRDGGVMPTAAVSCAVAAHDATAGVVLTASHNAWQDNGIKVLGQGGGKLLDPTPLERWLEAPLPALPGGALQDLPDPLAPWRAAMPQVDLSGLRVLLDCAHGAAAHCAPDLLRQRGATLQLRGCQPDGRNINAQVGALHPPDDLGDCDLGICLDGDGDRLLLLDRQHGALDGDDLLWLLDRGGPVIGTVMSNAGLDAALSGRLVRTPVGDRFVAEAMDTHAATVGGEPSGHLLVRGGPPSSCGLYTALAILQRHAGSDGRARLPLPVQGWERWPQSRRDVPSTRDLASLTTVVQAREAGLRVLVRYSGTEPLVRIMVEGRDAALADHWATTIAAELSPAASP